MTSAVTASDGARLDAQLVSLGLARSRAVAQDLLRAGRVSVDGAITTKPATVIGPGRLIEVTPSTSDSWVGRGAGKLEHALSQWSPTLDVRGRRCLDVGASTGGFTQVLLQRGAREVTALDVGHDQLVPELAGDPRVIDRSGTTVRGVRPEQLGGPFDVVVVDLSFLSLTSVVPELSALTGPGGDLVVLVKPQFEAGKSAVGKGGIVRSAPSRARAVRLVVQAAQERGLAPRAMDRSPFTGTHGNQEYLVWFGAPGPGMMSPAAVERAIEMLTRTEERRRGER